MKTKLKHISRRTIAMILCILMMFSTLIVGTITASANVDYTANSTILYLKPNANWKSNTPRFAAYFCNGTSSVQWENMSETSSGSGIYWCYAPKGNYKNVIFTRMDPNGSNSNNNYNNWENRWNQTGDLTLDTTNNRYTVTEGTWDSGTWDEYVPTPTTKEITADKKTIDEGGSVTFTPSINTTYAEIKSNSYTVTGGSSSDYTIDNAANKITFNKAGEYTVKDEITYNAKGFTGITDKVTTSEVTITVNPFTIGDTAFYFLANGGAKNWSPIYAYMWTGNGGAGNENKSWPGQEMTYYKDCTLNGTTYKIYAINNPNSYKNVIFNKGNKVGQSANLKIEAGKVFDYAGNKWMGMHAITPDSSIENGTVTFHSASPCTDSNKITEAQKDATVYCKAQPSTNYELDSITCKTTDKQTDVNVTNNNGVYSFTMPEEPVTVTATFKLKTFTVTYGDNVTAKDSNGNSITTGTSVNYGTSVTFTAAEVSGHRFDGLYSDINYTGSRLDTNGTYTTTIKSNTTVYAKYTQLYNVSIASNIANGTVTFDDDATASSKQFAKGDKYKVNITPDTNYKLDKFTVGTKEYLPTSSDLTLANGVYTYEGTVDSNVELSATFSKIKSEISYTKDDYKYTVTDLAATADAGDNVTFTVTPKDGYSVAVSAKDASNKNVALSGPTNNAYTFEMPASKVTITVTATAKTPTIIAPPISISTKTGKTFTITGVGTDTFATLTYTFENVTNATGEFTAPDNEGEYTLKITATHKDDSSKTATAEVTVKVSNSISVGSADITYYVDMHSNTGTPSIVIDGKEVTTLTKVVGSTTVYSATVATPYTQDTDTNKPIAISGTVAMRVDGIDYPVNVLDVGCFEINEVWLEADGKLSATTVEVAKNEVSSVSGTKRVYFTKPSDWSAPYLYAYNSEGGKNADWPGLAMKSTDWKSYGDASQVIYYFDVPSTYQKIIFSDGKKKNAKQTVDIQLADVKTDYHNHFYKDGDAITSGANKDKYNCGTKNVIAPKISKYYADVTLSTDNKVNIKPSTISYNTIEYSVTSGADVISVDEEGNITPLKKGEAKVKITAHGSYSVYGSDSTSVTTKVTVGETTINGAFDVMSYSSVQSTFTATNGSITSVTTSLIGSKFNSVPISGAGIVTKDGNAYTVKYAAANEANGYGTLKLNVKAVSQAAGDTYEFEKWTKAGTDVTGSATATFTVDGSAYNAVYKQVDKKTITITYKYNIYNTSDGKYYYDETAKDKIKEVTQTYTTTVIGDPTAEQVKQLAIDNMPKNLDNEYFDYTLDPANIAVNGSNATVTLTNTAHQYTIYIMSDKETIKYIRTYQHYIDANSSEFGFAENTDLIWYQSNKNGDLVSVLATGTNYRFRAIADNQYIYVVENTDKKSMNGSSAIISSGNKITTVNGTDKLNQSFYIADYFNDYTLSKELGVDKVDFVGAGVMYYSVDSTTGKPSNTTFLSSGLVDQTNGVGNKVKMNEFLTNKLTPKNFAESIKVTTDSNTKLGYRYLTAADGAEIYRYSDVLEAYQYIFTLTFTNSVANVSKNVRLYSYFVYSYNDNGTTKYVVSISDHYADASMYVSI